MLDRAVSAIAQRAALIIAVMGCAFLALLIFHAYATLDQFGDDFFVYWGAANGPVSAAYAPHQTSPFPYLPTMLLWIQPLSLVTPLPAFIGWTCISAMTFAWATRKYLTLGQNLLTLISQPVVFGLLTGQVSVFLAALMFWAFGTDRKWWAGIALGFVASIKPQLLLLAPLLMFLRRDFEMMIAAAASLLIIVLVALLAFGIQPWFDWLASLDHFRAVLNEYNILRAAISPANWAERLGIAPLPVMLLGAAFGSWIVYRCRNLGPVEVTAAVATASIFASPYALVYDMAAVVPFLVLTVWNNRIAGAVALTGRFLPLPIFLAAYELVRAAPSTPSPEA